VLSEDAESAGQSGLRWVLSQVQSPEPTGGGPAPGRGGAGLGNDFYAGAAGVLFACAEARLGGRPAADELASLMRDRLVAAGNGPHTGDGEGGEEPGLYVGVAGRLVGLQTWARVADDPTAETAADRLSDHAPQWAGDRSDHDIISGDAGVLLALVHATTDTGLAAGVGERLLAAAVPAGAGLDWTARTGVPFLMPNFSHGGAGIAYALAAAADSCGRPDFLTAAAAGGARLAELGDHPTGWVLPHSLPQQNWAAPVSYGWCHGPTGTVRLFLLLDHLQPAAGWSTVVDHCLNAIRISGLPVRRYPGFWDNLGVCCGTAGVGDLALDRFQATGDEGWLDWADSLAADVFDRAVTDTTGTWWQHTDHTAKPSLLPPTVGLMEGTAGIAAWLLRLARLHRDGPTAAVLRWPDRPLPLVAEGPITLRSPGKNS
jgi:lantibiotic modifying enzyme